jgi:hypothetical protein
MSFNDAGRSLAHGDAEKNVKVTTTSCGDINKIKEATRA